MKIIKNSDKTIQNILGVQKYSTEVNYKDSPYQIKKELDDCIIVENTLTQQVVVISENELDNNDILKQFLVENWYYFPEDVSPNTISYCVKSGYRSKFNHSSKYIDSYTIFTTLKCNARCNYCYEKGKKQISMNKETADAMCSFIQDNHSSNKVMLDWFGGEPLCNSEIIKQTCTFLQEKNIPYFSRMTSNGYLFSDFSDEEILDLWKLQQVQITLDGLSDTYNSIKNYKKGVCQDPFSHVLVNIKRLTHLGIHVTIRMNLSNENGDELLELSKFLADGFNENLTAYVHPLFEEAIGVLTDDEWNKVYSKAIQIDQLLIESKLKMNYRISKIPLYHCMADSGRHVCVIPNGKLTLCEHCTDTEIIGDVWNGITEKSIVQSWSEEIKDSRCFSCWNYPNCIKLKKCAIDRECLLGADKFWLYQETRALIGEYERFIERNKIDVESGKILGLNIQSVLSVANNEISYTLDTYNYWTEIYGNKPLQGWCLAFIYSIFKRAYPDVKNSIFYTPGYVSNVRMLHTIMLRKNKIYTQPEVGDLVFYDKTGHIDHVGLVVKVSEDDNSFDSIEGNVIVDGASQVKYIQNIPISDNTIVDFGRPNYTNE